jgi:hypothetical protein
MRSFQLKSYQKIEDCIIRQEVRRFKRIVNVEASKLRAPSFAGAVVKVCRRPCHNFFPKPQIAFRIIKGVAELSAAGQLLSG